MDKEDARYQKLEQLRERRKQVVRLHLRGSAVMQIVTLTGLSYPAVRKAIDLFAAGGWPAIKPAARGRNAGDGRLLSAEQEAIVRRTICDKRPEQLKMEFALWTRGAVVQFIEREFGIRVSIRASGEHLRRWGFTPQKPIKRAYEVISLERAVVPGRPSYDAALHALLLGFVFSMVFGHAPIVLPTVSRVVLPCHRTFYLSLALRHASPALRLWGDASGSFARVQWGALGSALALVAFIGVMAGALLGAGRSKRRARPGSRRRPSGPCIGHSLGLGAGSLRRPGRPRAWRRGVDNPPQVRASSASKPG